MSYLDTLFSLSGRHALVTGGTSGIGAGIAEALGRAGAAVTVVARTRSALQSTVEQLAGLGVDADAITCDVGERADLERLFEELGERPVDILVNSAGVNLRPPMGELTEAEYARTLAVNTTAPYLLGQRLAPGMARRGWGRLINLASQQAVRAFGNSGAYGISKAAVTGLTRSQAEAWSAAGVTSNAIVPGFVVTAMTQQTIAVPGVEQALAARTMVGRNGRPADFAGAAVWLASDAAGYVTGQTIYVDGGFSVH